MQNQAKYLQEGRIKRLVLGPLEIPRGFLQEPLHTGFNELVKVFLNSFSSEPLGMDISHVLVLDQELLLASRESPGQELVNDRLIAHWDHDGISRPSRRGGG